MKRVADEFLMSGTFLPYMKFALSKTEAHTLSALVDDQECDHLFANFKLDLVGNSRLPVTEDTAAVHEGKNPVGPDTLPDLAYLQLHFGIDASRRIALAAFAQHRPLNDELRMVGELFDRERDKVVRPNESGQRHQEDDSKAGNDSFHVELAAGSSRSL